MSEEINAIINNMCDRLGTSAKLLIPELARLMIAEAVTMLVVSLLMVIVGIICIRKSFKTAFADALTFIGMGVSIIGFILTVGGICSLVGWLASPTAKAILEIIRMVK